MTKQNKHITVGAYAHTGKTRKNNPPVGLVSSSTDKTVGKSRYAHDPHIGPQLSWAGKTEGTSFEVPDVSLHVHERIDSSRIIRSFLREDEGPRQVSLFDDPINEPPLHQAMDFYHHSQDWANRLIAGDSLLVMNSLLQKEGMAGKVQMVYIDPPYGIKYNSNFQPFVNKRNVKDNEDSELPADPEMIQAFRDTWELGIHSYLTYLRDRLLLAKELLHESGSCFVQISDENLHHVRELMDEVFGAENLFSVITFKKTLPLGSSGLASISDYIVWYCKDKKRAKYRQLYASKELGAGTGYTWVEESDGTRRRMTSEERQNPSVLPKGARPFFADNLMSSGYTQSCFYDFEFDERTFKSQKYSWKTNKTGMQKLIEERRLIAPGNLPNYVRYFNDFPVQELHNLWDDTHGASSPVYVVQTSNKVVQRCMLMCSDPGDLVFDPTCGAGTTAYVAEQWGRRWITCDTSRVALSLAKQRLMAANFDYYKLLYPDEGVGSGFEYKKVPHVTLGSIANSEPAKEEVLYDSPAIEKNKVRVTGPFTSEAVPSLRTKSFDGNAMNVELTGEEAARYGETGNQAQWRDELKATGIRATGSRFIEFARVEPAEGTHYIHATAEILEDGNINKTAVISFGPDYGPIEQRQVEEVMNETRSLKDKPDFVIFAAFQFDPEAAKDIDQIDWPGVQVLKAQMSVDLLTGDLRKKRSNNQSYWLVGQPDVDLINNPDGTYQVEVKGFDYYNPVTGEVDSGQTNRVAMWFLDTNYDERSLLPAQVFFPMKGSGKDWTPLAKALNGTVDEALLEAFVSTTSLPFRIAEHKKCAVKIIDDRGIESFVIKELK